MTFISKYWKAVVLAICVFVIYLVIFSNVLRAEADDPAPFFGSLAATVVTVFLYTRVAKKVGL
jgi:hypothetical protein